MNAFIFPDTCRPGILKVPVVFVGMEHHDVFTAPVNLRLSHEKNRGAFISSRSLRMRFPTPPVKPLLSRVSLFSACFSEASLPQHGLSQSGFLAPPSLSPSLKSRTSS